jgi:ring-1,2-phenylacetyl-CoA epoxidase subunit PaaD
MDAINREAVEAALARVMDPEMPTVSLRDLGMVVDVQVDPEASRVAVELTPTFLGCPALELIRFRAQQGIAEALGLDPSHVLVQFSHREAWSTDRVSALGREHLAAFGIAPPPDSTVAEFVGGVATVRCPFCGSDQTVMENLFGSAPCRALYYCSRCKNPFEVMKPHGGAVAR